MTTTQLKTNTVAGSALGPAFSRNFRDTLDAQIEAHVLHLLSRSDTPLSAPAVAATFENEWHRARFGQVLETMKAAGLVTERSEMLSLDIAGRRAADRAWSGQ